MPAFDPGKLKLAFRLTFQGAWPTGVALLDQGRLLAVGNRNGRLLLWELPEEPQPPAEDDERPKEYTPPALPPSRELIGHGNGVSRLLVGPDDRTLISASLDGTIRLWDTAAEPDGEAEIVVDSRDRERLAKRLRDETILERPGVSVKTQTAAHTIDDHDDWVNTINLSGDGRRLISGDGAGLTIVRELSSRQEISRWPNHWQGNWVTTAALSADGQTAFSAEYQSRRGSFDRPPAQARFYNAEDGSELIDVLAVRFPDVEEEERDNSYGYSRKWGKFVARGLLGADFSPDGKLLCAGQSGETGTGKVHLIETATGKLVRSVAAHEKGVTDCRFSPDGTCVLSTGRDTTLQICRVEDGKELAKLNEPRGGQFKDWLYAVSLSSDARRVAATDIAGMVHVWQAES